MSVDATLKKRPAGAGGAARKPSTGGKPSGSFVNKGPRPTGGSGGVRKPGAPFKPGFKKSTYQGKKPFDPKLAGGQKFAGKKFAKPASGSAVAAKPIGDATAESTDGTDASRSANPFEKKDWNKFKQSKKELKLKRKQGDNKDLFELTCEGKKVYEELRCKTTANKEELATKLFTLLRGADNFQKLVLAHDTARIVQCLLKHSPAAQRSEIADYLIAKVPEMAVSKYAHFCVLRLVKYGAAETKTRVIDALQGHVLRLCNNKYASTIVDTIYVSWASSQQKANLRQEWYGDLYKTSKDASVRRIEDTYAASPHIKLAIVNAVKANLEHIVNKKLVDNSLVHAVLLEFLTVCSEEERIEMAQAFNPYLPSLASTKDGSRAAMVIFFNSVVKDRRAIVKNLREHLLELCTHEHGHVLIIAIINSMDDTKALKKAIFDPMFAHIDYIAANEWGRRIVEWFVAPGDQTLFHPQICGYLEAGLLNSKKDKEVRRAEVAEAVEGPLCVAIAKNAAFWLRGGHTGLATAAILRRADHGKAYVGEAYEAVAKLLVSEGWKVPVREVGEKEPADLTQRKRKAKAMAAVAGEATAEGGADGAEAAAASEAKKRKISTKILKKYKSPFEKEKAEAAVEQMAGVEHAGLHIVLKKILKASAEAAATTVAEDESAAATLEKVSLGSALVEQLDVDTVSNFIRCL